MSIVPVPNYLGSIIPKGIPTAEDALLAYTCAGTSGAVLTCLSNLSDSGLGSVLADFNSLIARREVL
jgi:hypothetical protein